MPMSSKTLTEYTFSVWTLHQRSKKIIDGFAPTCVFCKHQWNSSKAWRAFDSSRIPFDASLSSLHKFCSSVGERQVKFTSISKVIAAESSCSETQDAHTQFIYTQKETRLTNSDSGSAPNSLTSLRRMWVAFRKTAGVLSRMGRVKSSYPVRTHWYPSRAINLTRKLANSFIRVDEDHKHHL